MNRRALPGGCESCILNGMQNSTTIRVSRETRDLLHELAASDGVTLDDEIRRLARVERQRRIGAALATIELTSDDHTWLDLGANEVSTTHAGR